MLHTRSDELRGRAEVVMAEVRAALHRILDDLMARLHERQPEPEPDPQPYTIPSTEATLTSLAENPRATVELSEAQEARVRQIRDKAHQHRAQPV